jgi:uncharacterized membrane protein HdeD (DUF308 family)
MKMCKAIRAVLLVLAGAVMILNLSLVGLSSGQLAGLLLLLSGLIKLAHAFGMCRACACCCVDEKKK